MNTFIFWLLILAIIGIAWRYASRRNAASVVTKKPKRLHTFTTAQTPEAIIAAIRQKVLASDYTLDSIAEENPRLMLSTPPSATTWGFFYPIYLTVQDDGLTLVEVGIESKLVQMGPLVRQQHEACVVFVKAALFE
jgi:heme/copper-type cytochrome/quinol oxidase subunit 2